MIKSLSRLIFLIVSCFTHSAPSANDYIRDQEKAKALMRQCDRPEADRRGSQAWQDCIDGGKLWDATSKRLSSDINQSIQNRDEERRRVQQDEMWREQIRRQR
jgi:hypothetical protein